MRLRIAVLLPLAVLSIAASGQRNWDQMNWQMDYAAAAKVYPQLPEMDARWRAWLPASQISRKAQLARVIERSTKVSFGFDWDRKGQLATVSFILPMQYDQAVAVLERNFGAPVSGDRSEARCFDTAGNRLMEDPSGVGHIVASCTANATFADRTHGNIYDLSTPYEWEMKPYGSSGAFGSRQLVTIRSIAVCGEPCKAPG